MAVTRCPGYCVTVLVNMSNGDKISVLRPIPLLNLGLSEESRRQETQGHGLEADGLVGTVRINLLTS